MKPTIINDTRQTVDSYYWMLPVAERGEWYRRLRRKFPEMKPDRLVKREILEKI